MARGHILRNSSVYVVYINIVSHRMARGHILKNSSVYVVYINIVSHRMARGHILKNSSAYVVIYQYCQSQDGERSHSEEQLSYVVYISSDNY